MTHLQDDHGMDVQVSDVTCPLCVKFTSGDRDILSLHIARHMEETALAILPTGVDSDDDSADESTSDATSSRDNEDPVTLAGQFQEDPTRDPSSIESTAYGSDTNTLSASVDFVNRGPVLSNYLFFEDQGAKEESRIPSPVKGSAGPAAAARAEVALEESEKATAVSKEPRHRSPRQDWESVKERICNLYLAQVLPIREVREIMQRDSDFSATYVGNGLLSN
jgi:hypothetical protein